MKKKEASKGQKSKYEGKVLDLGDGLEVHADANQYILRVESKYFYYVCIEHLLEDMYEMKRKEFLVAGRDKTIEGFIKATLKAKEWMEKAVEIKYANPYEKWRKDKEYRAEKHM